MTVRHTRHRGIVIANAGTDPADCPARIDAWARLMAARGQRVNALRLWQMQATMPALTLLTGLALPGGRGTARFHATAPYPAGAR